MPVQVLLAEVFSGKSIALQYILAVVIHQFSRNPPDIAKTAFKMLLTL